MLTITEIVGVSTDPFNDYPQLQTIWPEPFKATAIEATNESIQEAAEFNIGGLFFIKLDGNVIGITGHFYAGSHAEPYLRWHGIIPSLRRRGYSKQALNLMLTDLKKQNSRAEGLTELVPLCEYGQPLEKHFKHLGFHKVGAAERYDWSEYYWQPYRLPLK